MLYFTNTKSNQKGKKTFKREKNGLSRIHLFSTSNELKITWYWVIIYLKIMMKIPIYYLIII